MRSQSHAPPSTILSLIAALGLDLYKSPTYQGPIAVAGTLGSALAFLGLSLGIPAIPGGVYWMVKRRLMPGFPQFAWVIWFFLIATNIASLPFSNSSPSKTAYIPEGCEYSVEFPGNPKLTTFHVPGLGEIPRAEYVGGSDERGLFLRVECINFPKTQRDLIDNKEYLLNQSAAYAEANGIENAEFHYEDTELGRLVTLRGFKRVAEIPVTYEVHQYLGRRSLLSMYAGGASSHYPQVGVTEFFASARISDSKQTAEQALKLTVINGDYHDVERELNNKKWSTDDLGMALLAAVGKNKPRVAALLLTSGANPNYSVLYRNGVAIAASENNPEVLEVLLERGADPNWKATFDWRPLHFARRFRT